MELSENLAGIMVRDTSRALPLCAATGFLLGFRGSLTFLFFQSDPRMGTAVTAALTLGWALLVMGYTILDPPDRSLAASRTPVARWIVLYLAMSGASLTWTASNSVAVAAGYWAAMIADVVAVWLLLRYEPIEAHIIRLMQGFIVGAALIAIVAWIAPAMEDMRLGNEDFLHPNFIGFEFAIAALFAVFLAQQRKVWSFVCAGFVITTLRTLSKGTIVGFLFAALYYLVRGLKVSRKVRGYLALAGGLLLVGFWGLMEAYLDLYTQGSNLETLTGRTYIWSTALDIARDRLWFGYGFDSFRWVFPPFEHFQPWHAHNEWLQQLFAYGVVGLVVVIAVYVSFYRQLKASRNSALKSLATAIFILVLVRGLVDTDRFELCFPLWLMTMLSVALAAGAAPQHSV